MAGAAGGGEGGYPGDGEGGKSAATHSRVTRHRQSIMPLGSYVITFLVGTATGAAGVYFGAKFTDQRRKQESRKESRLQFEQVRAQMPELIAEMKKDLTEDGRSTVRDFCITAKNLTISLGAGETRFFYYDDDHQDLRNKATVLENHGYINLIESGYTPTYRMTERFVALIVQA